MRAARSRLWPDGQCASLAGSQGLFREEGLQGSVAAHPRGDWCVQQVACKEDRAFSRDLLKREGCQPRTRYARELRLRKSFTNEPRKSLTQELHISQTSPVHRLDAATE